MAEQQMIAERYMVVTDLGEGGMADVFLAIDTILNREVAVKVLRGELSKNPVTLLRFQREASAVSKLHHPNVVEVYDVGEYRDKYYIVMEYVRGRTLKQLISQRGALSTKEAVDIMKQLTSAVNHAHEHNIIHRDIKPQNVLVKDDGTVKITDFGIALAHDSVQLTQADSVLGSAHYIAPETTKGESATPQIDIYSLGIVFYELLTGKVPFSGDNPVQIAMKHLREDVPSVKDFNPTIPQSVENIVIKATAKNKVNRYPSAKDMLFDLNMCLLPEFSNVAKLNLLDANDDSSSSTMVMKTGEIPKPANEEKTIPEDTEVTSDKEKPTKKKKRLSKKMVAIIVAACCLVVGITTAGIYFSGIIDGFGPTEYVEVPDLSDLNENEAKAYLKERGLELDSDVSKKVTNDKADGAIIEQSPKKGKKVKKGTKIKITVSSGNYFVVDDYTGKTINSVEKELEDAGITIVKEYQTRSDVSAGTIISQSLLTKGDKVKPGATKQIKFVIASSPEFVMASYINANVDTAKATLEQLGAKVTTEVISQSGMSNDEKSKLQYNVVIRQSPEAGTYYTQSGDNKVTLYYYVDDGSNKNNSNDKTGDEGNN